MQFVIETEEAGFYTDWENTGTKLEMNHPRTQFIFLWSNKLSWAGFISLNTLMSSSNKTKWSEYLTTPNLQDGLLDGWMR